MYTKVGILIGLTLSMASEAVIEIPEAVSQLTVEQEVSTKYCYSWDLPTLDNNGIPLSSSDISRCTTIVIQGSNPVTANELWPPISGKLCIDSNSGGDIPGFLGVEVIALVSCKSQRWNAEESLESPWTTTFYP